MRLAHWRVSGWTLSSGLATPRDGTGNPGCVATAGALKSDADGASSSKPTHVEVDAAAADDPRGAPRAGAEEEDDDRPGLPSLRRSANMLVKLFMFTAVTSPSALRAPSIWIGCAVVRVYNESFYDF